MAKRVGQTPLTVFSTSGYSGSRRGFTEVQADGTKKLSNGGRYLKGGGNGRRAAYYQVRVGLGLAGG